MPSTSLLSLYPELFDPAAVLGFILAAVFAVRIIMHRGSPQATMAWLMAVVLVPFVGVPLYVVFGGRKLRRMARKKGLLDMAELAVAGGRRAPTRTVERLAAAADLPGAAGGNAVRFIATGEAYYAELLARIDQARESIHLQSYIFRMDAVGQEVVNRLAGRAERGVDVRLLLDDLGSSGTTRQRLAPLLRAGGKVAYFMPLLLAPFRSKANLRNHRKFMVFDGCRALSGGANIGREYLGPRPEPERWRDLVFCLDGPAAAYMAELFRQDWRFAAAVEDRMPPREEGPAACPAMMGDEEVQFVPSGPDITGDPLHDIYMEAMYAARQHLWLATPYLAPDEAMAQAVELAARRGVDVRLVMPARSDHWALDLVRSAYLRRFYEAGVRLLFHQGAMMHAKALYTEHLAAAGSANLDMRSFRYNYEAQCLFHSPGTLERMRAYFQQLFTESKPGTIPPAGEGRLFAEGLVRLAAPLL